MADLLAKYRHPDPNVFDRVIELHRDRRVYRLRFTDGNWWVNPAKARTLTQYLRTSWPTREDAEAYLHATFNGFGGLQEITTKRVDT